MEQGEISQYLYFLNMFLCKNKIPKSTLKNLTICRDDNVHVQQTMLLTEALEDKDILFRQQFYPDQDHSIPKYHKHLYHSLTDFLINDCFKWLRAVSKPPIPSIVLITIIHFDSRSPLSIDMKVKSKSSQK